MKKIYILFLMTFCLLVSAQEKVVNLPMQNSNIPQIADFKLYPNPVADRTVYITTKENRAKDIVVYNIFGEVVLKQRLIAKQLNISKLIPGMYLMQVTENKKTVTRKLVVK
ncbi:MAG: T9SS type A sorting domain-containing protein [Cellulophaga sp.]|uniref:T9SS type A sorting domain-containing protein n=1 Tax=unclassified Cellulophaga TaxID=2634405 RepID=UPI000C2C1645|nr:MULTISPECIES: T9SS type A sorting domain-containing protein [unclassified Cellulophaga]MDO6491742.1 T9SS type A sorting domain-containing protein [Cellulophaga sp. 2_MG-2023]MDO6495603.1 T9SS type A sorting domain-containing protein [Cellulophaga sp. 3_MG-2023]PKB43097.1 putative secreted protein (Por secretion system target) [Cellulophaga sp. RHA19]